MRPKTIILGGLLFLAAHAAAAQAVWRCGNSYGSKPCPGGTQVTSPDQPPPGAAQGAARVAATDAKLAAEMEKARLAQEKNAPRALIIGGETPAKEAPKAQEKKTPAKPEYFTASTPGKKKKKP